jgi:ketosteroid isomerase-like protein
VSERNIELARRLVEAYNARDVEAYIACHDPSIEFYSAFAAVSGGVYHGHDGVRRFFQDMEDAWGRDIRIEPETYFDLREQVLAYYVLHGRGQNSGVEVAMPNAAVVTWREGLVVYFRAYTSREDALRDLGVSEDELEPIEP